MPRGSNHRTKGKSVANKRRSIRAVCADRARLSTGYYDSRSLYHDVVRKRPRRFDYDD